MFWWVKQTLESVCFWPTIFVMIYSYEFPVQLCGKAKDTKRNRKVIFKVNLRSTLAAMFCWVKSNPVHKTSTNKFTSIDVQDRQTISLAIQRLQGITLVQEVDRHESGQKRTDNTLKILSNKKLRKHQLVSASILFSTFLRITAFRISQNHKNVRWKMTWGHPLLVERDLLPMTDKILFGWVLKNSRDWFSHLLGQQFLFHYPVGGEHFPNLHFVTPKQ